MRTKRAAIYCRISDARDGDTAGVDRQEKDARKLCRERGYTVAEVFIDNSVSAFSGRKRPEYDRMMAAAKDGNVEVIVTYAADRLYRRLADLERLVTELGDIHVETVRSGEVDLTTADGRMTARILGSVSQHESEKKGERISRAYRERAECGQFGGGQRRFGYNGSMTELVPDEARELRQAYERIADGWSLRSVVRDLNDRDVRTPSGKPWVNQTIRSMLLRPANGGHATYKGQLFEGRGKAPAIVDTALWAQVHAILTDPTRRLNVGAPRITLLSGIAVCGVCDGTVRASQRQHGRTTYRCYDGAHVTRGRDKLDEYVTAAVLAFLDKNRAKIQRKARRSGTTDPNTIAEATRLRRELERLPRLLAAGELDASAFAAADAAVRERLALAEAQIAASSDRAATSALLSKDDLAKAWDGLDIDGKRAVLKEVIDAVVIGRSPKDNRRAMETVQIRWAA